MKIIDIMERTGLNKTGQAIAFIKEALDEIAIISETHTETVRMDLDVNKRFYNLPNNALRILDIRCKNHNNGSAEYRSIPRSVFEPPIEDTDGI